MFVGDLLYKRTSLKAFFLNQARTKHVCQTQNKLLKAKTPAKICPTIHYFNLYCNTNLIKTEASHADPSLFLYRGRVSLLYWFYTGLVHIFVANLVGIDPVVSLPLSPVLHGDRSVWVTIDQFGSR